MKLGFEKVATAAIVLLLTHGAEMLRADMVAYWKFDDANGTTAADRVGGHNGTLVGSPVWVDGYFGGALRFDGVDDYVTCGGGKQADDPNTWADIDNAITLAAWIRVDAFTKEWQSVITKGDSAWRIARGSTTNNLDFACTSVSGAVWGVGGRVNVNDGRWHHVAGIYDGSAASLYVDGEPEGSVADAKPIKSNNFDVAIGENTEQRQRQWRGLIDEVVIFNHALSQDELKQLHELGGESFLSERLRMLGAAAREAESALKEKGAREAADVVEEKIAEQKQAIAMDLEEAEEPYRIAFSKLYSTLAKAKQASRAPATEVADAYRQSASISAKAPDYVPSLLWLFRNTPADDYTDVIRRSVRNTPGVSNIVAAVTSSFEAEGNWAPFKLFLDAAFSEIADTAPCVEGITAGLRKDGEWSGRFLQYCRGNTRLTPYIIQENDKAAAEAIRKEQFLKAAEIHRDTAGLCDDSLKMDYQFRICECLFLSGQTDKSLPEIDGFVEKYRATDRRAVIQAILLKGQAYLQLNDVNRASDVFLELLIDYPETKNAPETHFFLGHCNMLQGNLDEAREAFDLVLKSHPGTTYAGKARLCMRRIERMSR